ncbi:MAG: 4Fe-4S binding protein [Desulfamplus sp.]|nr:4Fe-4S binding protein [Desulfamplus sp.]
MTDVYKKLAEHLDKTPGGFPPTESGVELRILKQLFTEEEAEIAASLIMIPETPETIGPKVNKTPDEVAPILKEMAHKGLILHSAKGGVDTYMSAQFVVGIWEYQVNRLTKELIQDFNEYVPFLMKEQTSHKTQQLRVIPISRSISADMKVMDYEEAENIIRAQSKILIAPCICRTEHKMVGEGCHRIVDGCFVFGGGAFFYEERGIGRTVDQNEAIEILHKGIEQGLVLQPGNSLKPMNLCMCCDCCCQILSNIKKTDKPSTVVNSSYFAVVNHETCTACALCEERCPMDAITMGDTAEVNLDRCIGCGVCAGACDFDSISLHAKDEDNRWIPPDNVVETYMNIAREKGLM